MPRNGEKLEMYGSAVEQKKQPISTDGTELRKVFAIKLIFKVFYQFIKSKQQERQQSQ